MYNLSHATVWDDGISCSMKEHWWFTHSQCIIGYIECMNQGTAIHN